MRLWRIGDGEQDLPRVMNYAAKGLEAGIDGCEWKFIDQLSPAQSASSWRIKQVETRLPSREKRWTVRKGAGLRLIF